MQREGDVQLFRIWRRTGLDWFLRPLGISKRTKVLKKKMLEESMSMFLFLDRGDFLAAFSRNVPGDQKLEETFRRHFIRVEETEEEFNFETFLMEHMDRELGNLSVIADHMNLLRSDHSQFWVVNNKEYFASLPAILLSDLGQSEVLMSEVI